MEEISLRALHRGEPIFTSTGKWLHPLLEFEAVLAGSGIDPAAVELEDKIIGKAAALLMVRLGIRTVRAGIASDLALEVFRRNSVSYRYERKIPRIACMTEELLADIDDPEQAYRIISERAAAARGRIGEAGSGTRA